MRLNPRVLTAASLLLLGSCAVYAPTVPGTPLLTKGQAEATASLRGLSALEVSAAWSPVPHLLLTAEGAIQAPGGGSYTSNGVTTTYEDHHRQGGVGLGYYHAPAGPGKLYLAAVGGVGWASVNLHDPAGKILTTILLPFLPGQLPFYEARYRRYYGQVYLAQRQNEQTTSGFSVRGTWVDYTQLTLDRQPYTPASRFFIEPHFFLRSGKGPLQGYFTLGLSLPTGRSEANGTEGKTAPISGLIGAGVVVRPHLVGRPAKQVQP